MIDEATFRKKDKKVYKVVLILLVALASISGAKKDLNQFLALATDVHTFANHLISMLPANEALTVSPVWVCQIKEHTL